MPKSVFKSPEARARYLEVYDAAVRGWPVAYDEFDVTTGFGSTHGLVSGPVDAPPLLLLSGNFASLTAWSACIAQFSQSYRVFALDTIDDLGKSIPERLPTSRADYATWLGDVIRGLGLSSVHLLGHSYGGFLAFNFALAEPQAVNRLVLLSPGLPFAPPTAAWMWGMPMTLWPSPRTVRLFMRHASVKGFPNDDPFLAQMAVGVPGLRNRVPLRPRFTAQEYAGLAVPTLLLLGDREIKYDARKAISRARKLCPGLMAEIILDAGHTLNFDQPEITCQKIMAFLGK